MTLQRDIGMKVVPFEDSPSGKLSINRIGNEHKDGFSVDFFKLLYIN